MGKLCLGIASGIFILILAPMGGARAGTTAQTRALSADSPSVRARIDEVVAKDRKLFGGRTPVPAVLIGVWDGHGGTYIRAYGYADMASRRTLTAADHFRIGSNTKTFVVAVILQLIDEGKMRIDDPLSKFNVGVRVPNAKNITVRQLCDMRSGLFEGYDTPQIKQMNITGSTKFDPRQLIGWTVQHKPYFPPNARYRYTNTNYLLLGQIIEAVTHDTVGNQIRKRFIIPYRLTQTSYPDSEAMPSPRAHGYGLDKNRNWEDVSNTVPVSLMGAAGEMISDMNDMRRWIPMYVMGKETTPATRRMFMSAMKPIGEGDMQFGLALGGSSGWYGYTGGLPGYNTSEYYFPSGNVTIVSWVTLQKDHPAPGVSGYIMRDIAEIMTPRNVPFQTYPRP